LNLKPFGFEKRKPTLQGEVHYSTSQIGYNRIREISKIVASREEKRKCR